MSVPRRLSASATRARDELEVSRCVSRRESIINGSVPENILARWLCCCHPLSAAGEHSRGQYRPTYREHVAPALQVWVVCFILSLSLLVARCIYDIIEFSGRVSSIVQRTRLCAFRSRCSRTPGDRPAPRGPSRFVSVSAARLCPRLFAV